MTRTTSSSAMQWSDRFEVLRKQLNVFNLIATKEADEKFLIDTVIGGPTMPSEPHVLAYIVYQARHIYDPWTKSFH